MLAELIREYQLFLGLGDKGQNRPGLVSLWVQVKPFDAFLTIDIWSASSKMVKFLSRPISAPFSRSIRARMPWKVPAHILLEVSPQKLLNAFFHFFRGFVGECYREDIVRRYAAAPDEVGYAECQHARLAAARARKHQYRPFGVGDSRSLVFV